MKAWPALLALVACGAASAADGSPPTMAAMRGHRRIVLMATPGAGDPQAVEQRRILAGWKKEAAARDISLVELTGAEVTGAADDAAALARRYRLKPDRFEVLLIGKDGHVAVRSRRPVTADRLQATIDAMPMHQAGER